MTLQQTALYSSDHINEDEFGGAFDRHVRGEKCTQIFGAKPGQKTHA
jgi:hypothetical protein